MTQENRRFDVWQKGFAGRLAVAFQVLTKGSRAEKRRVRQELASMAARLFGDYRIGDDYKRWYEDKEFNENFTRLSPHNQYSKERKYALREFARYARSLPGEMAECGCYVGVSAWFMASEKADATLYLFDSFEGLSEPGDLDRVGAGVRGWLAGDMAASEEKLRENLCGFDRICVLKGWIPGRFCEIADRRFKLVHIDVDLYQPTRDSLEFFYPRMVSGGVIVMDDYGFLTCPGAARAADEFMEDKPGYIINLPTGQGVIFRGAAAD